MKAAQKAKVARRTAYRWAQIAVDKKQIEPTCIWPKLFQKKLKSGTLKAHPRLGPKVPLSPLVLPHKYGGVFMATGRPKGLIYDSRGGARIKEGSHTAQFGRKKTVIWIKHFRGTTVPEILTNAYNDLMQLADYYAHKYNITLTLGRVFDGIEWTVPDRFTSAKTSDLLGIKEGEQTEIAKSMFKFGDKSHPGVLEINQAPEQPVNQATKNVKELEYLLLKGREELETIKKDIISVVQQQNELIKVTKEGFGALTPKEEPKKPFGERPEGGKDYI